VNKKISILVVDDDANLGDSLTDILDAKGYDARFATRGKEALTIIKENEIDAIFLDIRMPEMNGVETLSCIKKYSPMTSVVMITAYAEDELVEQAYIEGALQVLKKPLDIEKLISFLEKLQRLKTLLIVDDSKSFCITLRECLDDLNYNVDIAYNVDEGIEKFDENNAELLLIDIKLNGDNGLDLINTIRERGSKSAIILMSGYVNQFQPIIDDAIKNKVDHFIEKPFEMKNIIKIIGEVTRKRLKDVLS
jgi:two-component system, NtrC family, response regulator HydG